MWPRGAQGPVGAAAGPLTDCFIRDAAASGEGGLVVESRLPACSRLGSRVPPTRGHAAPTLTLRGARRLVRKVRTGPSSLAPALVSLLPRLRADF